ncbi:MAG TPA: cytochrome c oxidase subunit II [Solirubrobacteraceae bacterium]|nr:cytochrome c oxidase subunit II [Solirubrobacteraceae bacterium]
MRSGRLAGVLLVGSLALGGCGQQDMLDPVSRPAREIATLWWWMLGVAGVVLGGALALLAIGWLRREHPGLPLVGGSERLSRGLVIVFGILIPLVVNIAVFVTANFVVAKTTDAPDPRTTAMTIRVVGHQWWWEIRYPGSTTVTANEIHIPAATRVNIVATTADVIHSFWVPQLNRKIDMIPGQTNRVLLEADRPGRYRGQCAEFCGLQHAHMAMYVDADTPQRFKAWLHDEATPRQAPATASARDGERLFEANACASCHQIRGTSAHGQIGPDLTHVGSRATLAALTIPNRPAELERWIRDPQHVKPGNRMPALGLSDAQFRKIATYLEGLK